MLLMLQASEHAGTLALVIVVAVIYLLVIRFIDLNEKEPLWAIGLLFLCGALLGGVTSLLVSSVLLETTFLPAAWVESTGMFVAVVIGFVALSVIGRLRGFAEVNGLMDGIVYGATAGLGFSVGQIFVRELLFPSIDLPGLSTGPFATLWTTALVGLADGLFGALIGAGFGLAAHSRSVVERAGYPVAGYMAAIVAHYLYLLLGRGNALGDTGLMQTWAALLLPLVAVVVVAVYALNREKRAIRDELSAEAASGIVTEDERRVLSSFSAKQSLYLKQLTSGNYGSLAGLRALHNRQVQLALAKRRAATGKDAGARAIANTEIEQLRQAVRDIKADMAGVTGPQNVKGAQA